MSLYRIVSLTAIMITAECCYSNNTVYLLRSLLYRTEGDNSTCSKPPVDFKTKVPFKPGHAGTGQAKVELLF